MKQKPAGRNGPLRSMAERSYPTSKVGVAAERSYPTPKIRDHGQDEQPQVQGAMAVQAQEG